MMTDARRAADGVCLMRTQSFRAETVALPAKHGFLG
jgi:hypothetical protein